MYVIKTSHNFSKFWIFFAYFWVKNSDKTWNHIRFTRQYFLIFTFFLFKNSNLNRSTEMWANHRWTWRLLELPKPWLSYNLKRRKKRLFTTETCLIMLANTVVFMRPLAWSCAMFVGSGFVMAGEILLALILSITWWEPSTKKSHCTGRNFREKFWNIYN